jgi:peptidoglycan/LPS O-acetylase OafA/YrhL
MRSNFRQDISGLRAMAVIGVMLFHAGFDFIPGGFVGVDVFFVISGFLITQLIRREHQENIFSFQTFYLRRFRRLFPALFITLFLSFLIMNFILSISDIKNLSNSSLYSIFALSNIYFYEHSGYFDLNASLKPLLHIWSLSVEEQFYFVWPSFLLVCFLERSDKFVVLSILLFSISSLIFSYVFTISDPTAAFFLTPFRVFEFGIGALMVWAIGIRKAKSAISDEITFLIGFGLVAASMLYFSERIPFPSYNALAPCLGAAAIIFSDQAKYSGYILRNPIMVWIGERSYSLYLAHWPVVVFYNYRFGTEKTVAISALLLLIGVIWGVIQYRFIEVPFRYPSALFTARRFVLGAASATAVLVAILGSAAISGWEWRVPLEFRAISRNQADYHIDQFGGNGFEANKLILLGIKSAKPAFFIIGDSFSHQYAAGLDEELNSDATSALAYFDNGCLLLPESTRLINGSVDQSCSDSFDIIKRQLSEFGVPIILSSAWNNYFDSLGDQNGNALKFANNTDFEEYIMEKISELKIIIGNRRFVLIGMPPGAGDSGVVQCMSMPKILGDPCAGHLEFPVAGGRNYKFNNKLKELSEKLGASFVDPAEVFCQSEKCKAIIDGKIMYSDGSHLSKDGSKLFSRHFHDIFNSMSTR